MFNKFRAFSILVFGLSACGSADGIVSQAGGSPPYFTSALVLDASQISSLSTVQYNTFAEFNRYQSFALVPPSNGAAIYDGSMVAKFGDSEQYIGGAISLTLDLSSGTGLGRVGFISMEGPGTVGGLADLSSALDINVTDISGSTVTGTITGEFSDRAAFDRQFSEEFQVDTSFDARVVDINGGRPGLVGTISGTIDPESAPMTTLDGVLTANDTLGF